MPNDKLEAGLLNEVNQSNYNPKNEGGVIDKTGKVAAPVSTNLLLDTPVHGGGNRPIKPGDRADAIYANTMKNTPINALGTPVYSNAKTAERYTNNEIGGFHPYDMNQEDWYGKEQGWFTQMGNRIGKFGVKTVGSFANALMDIPVMVNAIAQGDASKLWDNPINTWASDLMEWSEKVMPNYKTNWETEHPFLNLVPFYGNAGNSWGNVLEQTGFTVGAIGGAIVEDLAIGALTGGVGEVPLAAMQINKAIYSLGKMIGKGDDALDALKSSIKSSDDIIKGLKGIDRFNYGVREGLWGANMITSGFSEAGFEGIETHKTLSKDLKKQFIEENGRIPSYEEGQKIEETARTAANTRFGLNAALLAFTNTIQWGSLMRPFNATKEVLEAEAKAGVRTALKAGSRDVFEVVEPTSKFVRFGNAAKNNVFVEHLTGSASEGFEEGAQYAIQMGTEDFYRRKYNGEAISTVNNVMKSFSKGLSETLGTQQGWENMVYGLLGGAMFKAGETGYRKANGQSVADTSREQVDAVVKGLNSSSLTGIFENKYGEAVAAAAIEKDLQAAAKNGDLFQYKNLKHEQFANFVISGIQQNKFETRLEQLRGLKSLKEDEFQTMFGVPSTTENKRNISSMVDKMVQNAQFMKDVHERVSRTFVNPFKFKGTGNYTNKNDEAAQLEENLSYVAYEEAKNELVLSMGVAKDSSDRINTLRNNISAIDGRVSPDTIVNLASEKGFKKIKGDYNERIKTLEDGLKLASDPKTAAEVKWLKTRVEELDTMLTEKDKAKKLKAYNSLLSQVVAKELENNGDTTPVDGLKAKEMLGLGHDVAMLQHRNEKAIDAYSRLTTRGSFKKLFNDIIDVREEVAKQAVALDPEQPVAANPLAGPVVSPLGKPVDPSADEKLAILSNNPDDLNPTNKAQTAAPVATSNAKVPNNGNVVTQEAPATKSTIPPDQLRRIKIIVEILEGKYLATEFELGDLKFETLADLKFAYGKEPDLSKYTKVKSIAGMEYFMLTEWADRAKAIVASIADEDVTDLNGEKVQGENVPQNFYPEGTIPPNQNAPTDAKQGMYVENFLAKIYVPNGKFGEDLRVPFNTAIYSGQPQDVIKDITVTVEPLPENMQKEYDEQRKTQAYTPYTGYDGVFIAKAPISLAIEHKGQRIGYISYPERLLFKVGNNFVTIDKLTPLQYHTFTRNPHAQHAVDVKQFHAQVAFKNYLAIRFKENGNNPVTLTSQELESLMDLNISYGSLDLVADDKARPKYSDVKNNKISFAAPDGTIQSTIAIVSIPRIYTGDVSSRESSWQAADVKHGQEWYDSGATTSPALQYVREHGHELLKLNSRYIGVTQRPDGVFTFIALRAGELDAAKKDAVFASMKERSAKSLEENVVEVASEAAADYKVKDGDKTIFYKLKSDTSRTFNDAFNTELNNTMFISDNNGKLSLNLSISPMGVVRLEVYNPLSKYRDTVYVSPQVMKGVNNFSEFAAVLSKEIAKKAGKDTAFAQEKVVITESNFRENIAKDNEISAEALSERLTAATTVEITKDGKMTLVPKGTEITRAYNEVKSKLAPVTTVEETKAPVVEEAPAKDVADEAIAPSMGAAFGALTFVQTDDMGRPVDVEEPATSSASQEDQTEIEYPTVMAALNANGITFVNDEIQGVVFIDLATNKPLPNLKGTSPLELTKSMGLKLAPMKPRKEEDEDDMDFKLVNDGVEVQRMINIEKARVYLANTLPSFIGLEDINTILDKISVEGQVFGAFSKGVIYLNSAAEAGTEYHEAFHAVFRMLLNDQQIDEYLAKGQESLNKQLKKEGSNLRQLLAEKRAIGLYATLNDKEAYDRLYEEHMADAFQQWKTKKDNAGFFEKLFDLIRKFFKWFKRDGKDIEALFANIDNGSFKYSNSVANRFTSAHNDEYNEPEFAFSLIPGRPRLEKIGSGNVTIKRNLDAKTSKQVIQNVAAYYILERKLQGNTRFTDDQLLDNILDDLKNTYHPEAAQYAGWTEEQKQTLLNSDQSYIYANEDTRKIIKDGAKQYISTISFIEQFEDEDLTSLTEEEPEQELGNDQPATGFDNRAENNGGFSSLPKLLREYIGFTTYEVEQDIFGNTQLYGGNKIIGTVDSLSVYYGLLRSLANITDPVKFFQKMFLYASSSNEQTMHFVEKFIADTGFDKDALFNENRIVATKNRALVELIRKGFNKYRIDYIFSNFDTRSKTVESYHANRKNVEQTQFASWSNAFLLGYAESTQERQDQVRKRITEVRDIIFDPMRTTKYTTASLEAAVKEVRNSLIGVGVYLSADYIKYSLLKQRAGLYDKLAAEYKAQGTELPIDDAANRFISKEDYQYVQVMSIPENYNLDKEVVDQLVRNLVGETNPFFKEEREVQSVDDETQSVVTTKQTIDTAMIGRLLDVAKGNAMFDESVGESSYMNAEGKLVYAHQDGTFNVKASYSLRDAQFRKQLRETGVREEITAYKDEYDKEWLTQNPLLNSEEFEAIADTLMFQRIDGMRAVEKNSIGRIITQEFREQKEGVTYGGYSPREFIVNLMNMYISYATTQRTAKGNIITTPHLIRVLEASKTGDTVNLPINLDIFSNGSVTEKTVTRIYNEAMKEFRRISRVQSEIGNLKFGVVENYHTGSFAEDGFTVEKGYRGLQFTDNIVQLIGKNLAKSIADKARRNEQPSQEEVAQIKAAITESMNNMVTGTVDIMVKENIINRDAKGNYSNVLLYNGVPGNAKKENKSGIGFFNGHVELNLKTVKAGTTNFVDNVGQVIINDYLNTLAYNHILHGDPALSLKNDGGIDAVKRAKGDNAAIVPMRTDLIEPSLGITEPFTHSKVAIFKEPKGFSEHVGKQVDVADAQMYTTVKGLRYTLWGLGRLNKRVAKLLDALENGENIHALVNENGRPYDAIFDPEHGSIKWHEQTNSLKLVFKDGKSYFKMSVVMLQPDLTSVPVKRDENGKVLEWKPRPGWETLHNLRTSMETKGVTFSAPQSASKMMTMDVGKASDFSDLQGHLFSNEYFGLQTENPSNKLEITTPTQLLQIIDTEQDDDVDVHYAGETIKVGELKTRYQNYVGQKVTNAYEITRQEMYEIQDFANDVEKSISEGKVTPKLAEFQETAVRSLEASGSDAQLVDFFSLDENGVPKFNLNMSATKTKFAQLYLSYFSKGILSQKNPGYTVALFSGIDTKLLKRATRVEKYTDENGEERTRVLEWDVVRRAQYDANHKDVQSESYFSSKDEVKEEGQLFLAELEYNAPEYNEKGEITGYFSEMMLPPHYKEFLGVRYSEKQLPEAIAKSFGVRIPSQDKHSFMAFKLVDFLPANLGSTGMFPKELIALSGADFDIDKEFISRFSFYTEKDENGKTIFKKYGDATTPEGKWEEYKKWMTTSDKTVKNIIRRLASKNAGYQELIKDEGNVNLLLDITGQRKTLRDRYRDGFISEAFKQIGVPSTLEEYTEASKTREYNNGVINNRIVEAFIKLLTNKGMHDIAKTPATLTELENIQKNKELFRLNEEGEKVGNGVFSKSTNFPVDSIAGKYHAFKNNTTGKNNIGIDVNANLIYSVLSKGGIELRGKIKGFEFDGKEYRSFKGNKENEIITDAINDLIKDGKRTNDILSTLISSATDEAKEQLNALYGLTVDALKVVNYLVSLKVPLKTAVYLVNQPSVRNYLDIKAVKQNTLQTKEEENTFRSQYQEAAMKKTAEQIKEYNQMSENELFGMLEREGVIEVKCS